MSAEEHEQERDSGTGTKPVPRNPFGQARIKGRRPKIKRFLEENQDVWQKVLQFITQGVYDYVAAEAMGISHRTWMTWKQRGETDERLNKNTLYRQFYRDISTASARARLLAELEVRRDDPKFFLTHGPGKPKRSRPGWSPRIEIGGVEDMPVEVEVREGQTDELHDEVSTMATVLSLMEEMGFATPTDAGKVAKRATQRALGLGVDEDEDLDAADEDGDGDGGLAHYPGKDLPAQMTFDVRPDGVDQLPEKFR